MNLDIKKSAVIILIFLIVTTSVEKTYAGTAVSGGGGAYVCRNAAGVIKSTHLVDLWESENTPFHWHSSKAAHTISVPVHSQTSVDEQTHNALKNLERLDSALAARVSLALDFIKTVHRFLPPSISLTVPNDLQTDYFPTGCPPEGMLRYNGYSQTLDIKQDLFDKLATNTDISASYMHEALYKVLRETYTPATNSILIRRLNACLYSAECMNLALSAMLPKDRPEFFCQSKNLEVTLYPVRATSTQQGAQWKMFIHRAGSLKFGAPIGAIVSERKEQKVETWFERFDYQPFIARAKLVSLASSPMIVQLEDVTSFFPLTQPSEDGIFPITKNWAKLTATCVRL